MMLYYFETMTKYGNGSSMHFNRKKITETRESYGETCNDIDANINIMVSDSTELYN